MMINTEKAKTMVIENNKETNYYKSTSEVKPMNK